MRVTAAPWARAFWREAVLCCFLNTTIFTRRIGHLFIDRTRRQSGSCFAGRILKIVTTHVASCQFRFVGEGMRIRESRGKFIE
jgi:hypothetical protein